MRNSRRRELKIPPNKSKKDLLTDLGYLLNLEDDRPVAGA